MSDSSSEEENELFSEPEEVPKALQGKRKQLERGGKTLSARRRAESSSSDDGAVFSEESGSGDEEADAGTALVRETKAACDQESAFSEEPEFDRSGDALKKSNGSPLNELKCSMCLDTLYKPVSLSCGHSFCRVCLITGIKHMKSDFYDRFSCPSCRKTACAKCYSRFQVNTALWGVIQALYPELTKERNDESEKAEFDRAFREFANIPDSGSHSPLLRREKVRLWRRAEFSRSVIQNPGDLVMHLALVLIRNPNPFPLELRQGKRNKMGTWRIQLALSELEEDEDESCGGFPALLRSSDGDNRDFIRGGYGGEVVAKVFGGDIDGTSMKAAFESKADFNNGVATLDLDPRKLPKKFGRLRIEFRAGNFEGLMCTCDMVVKESTTRAQYSGKAFRGLSSVRANNSDEDEDEPGIDLMDSDNESEPEDLNQFENDGFIVMDGDEEDDSDANSDEDQASHHSDESIEELFSDSGEDCVLNCQMREEMPRRHDDDRESIEEVDEDQIEMQPRRKRAGKRKKVRRKLKSRRKPSIDDGSDDEESSSGGDASSDSDDNITPIQALKKKARDIRDRKRKLKRSAELQVQPKRKHLSSSSDESEPEDNVKISPKPMAAGMAGRSSQRFGVRAVPSPMRTSAAPSPNRGSALLVSDSESDGE